MNTLDWAITTFILGSPMKAAMDALNPSLYANMSSGTTLAVFVVCDFVLAFLLVWTYAAIRPRFGPGPKTASYAGLLFWAVLGTFWASISAMGLFPWALYPAGAAASLVNMLASANVGAALYKE
jgi:hypothetical protein